MENKLMFVCLKNTIKELTEEKYMSEKRGLEKSCLDLTDTLEKQTKEIVSILDGLVNDVSNLLANEDIEWQQAGYFEEAKLLLERLNKK